MKIETDSELMVFILKNYSHVAKKRLDLVPLSPILSQLKEFGNDEEKIKKLLIRLRILNLIELRTTKTIAAINLGIELLDINGVKYGFVKILNYNYKYHGN